MRMKKIGMKLKHRYLAVRVLCSAAAVVTLGACATKGDIRNLQMDVQALSARQDSLMRRLMMDTRSTQDTLRTQSDQLFDFRGEITRQLRVIAEGLETLEALAGENQRGIAGVRDQMANLRRSQAAPPPVTSGVQGDPSGQAVGGAAGDGNQLYESAMEQYRRSALNTARRAFEDFLENFPNHERAPDAYFFLADVLYQQDDLDGALAAYRELPTRWPLADRVPSALYRVALILIEQDDLDEARTTLQRIINTYGDSDTALIARDKLDEIGPN